MFFSLMIFGCSIYCNAQKQDSSSDKDTVVILTLQEANILFNYIQLQSSGKVDVKLETWEGILDMIRKKIVAVPKNKK